MKAISSIEDSSKRSAVVEGKYDTQEDNLSKMLEALTCRTPFSLLVTDSDFT